MAYDLSKSYYKISEVAEILDVPASTLRYWENEFTELKPRRSTTNRRTYTPSDIETLRIIKFLLKERGLKIDAAKQQLKGNRKNISRKIQIIDKLLKVRGELNLLLGSLSKRRDGG